MRRNSWVLPVSVAVLVGLLGLLGTLQYRWLGRVAETIAVEKRQSLLRRGTALAAGLEREITRAFLWFVLEDPAAPGALGERWASWRETGRSVGLVKGVFLVRRGAAPDSDSGDGAGAGATLARVDPGSPNLTAVPWPAALRWLEQDVSRRPPMFGPPRLLSPMVDGEVDPVLLVLAGEPERDALVLLVLDDSYLTSTLWPELAREHLNVPGDATAVVASLRREARAPLAWPANARADDQGEHPPIPILGVRPDLATAALLFGARPRPSALLDSPFGPRRRPPRSLGRGDARGGHAWRGPSGDLLNPFGPLGPPPGLPPPRGMVRFEDRNRPRPDFREGPAGAGPRSPPWSLSVAYAGGPVDELVDTVRRRNLAISFGIMGILGGAISVLALAFRRAQRLASRQQEFLASVSHELRTPLAVIGSAAENLRDGTIEEGPRVREYGAMIGEESRRLTAMVDDVLRLAAGQSVGENLHLEPVDARAIVDSAVDSLQPEIRARGGRIERVDPDGAALVSADVQALRQVVENVVGNALKYGGERPLVTLRIAEVEGSDGPEVQITITDRGIGIPPAEMGQIFEPFFRGREALSRQIHGTGLGLSLVARVMKAHRGRVTVQSAPGRGSSFVLRLPVGRA